MFKKHTRLVAACLALCVLPGIAQAYIGPGAGITFIGALIGVVLAVFSAIGFILFWPIRRMLAKRKGKGEAEAEVTEAAEASPEEEDAVREGAPADS